MRYKPTPPFPLWGKVSKSKFENLFTLLLGENPKSKIC
jgi:hypothetical protein